MVRHSCIAAFSLFLLSLASQNKKKKIHQISKVHKLTNQVLKNSQLPDNDLDKDESIGLDYCNNDQYLKCMSHKQCPSCNLRVKIDSHRQTILVVVN